MTITTAIPRPRPQQRIDKRHDVDRSHCLSSLFPSDQPIAIRTAEAAGELGWYLLLPHRERPVVVLTTRADGGRPWADPARLKHDFDVDVAVIDSSDVCLAFAGRVGRRSAVSGGYARVYPSDAAWQDDPALLPRSIEPRKDQGVGGFDHWLRICIGNQINREQRLVRCSSRLLGDDANAVNGRMMTASDGSMVGYSVGPGIACAKSATADDDSVTVADDLCDALEAGLADPAAGVSSLIALKDSEGSARLIADLAGRLIAEHRQVDRLRRKVEAMKGDCDKAREHAQRQRSMRVQQEGRYRTMRGMFVDDRERLSFERERFSMWIRETWALMVDAREKALRPLPEHWDYEDGFFDAMARTQVDRQSVLEAAVDVLTGVAMRSKSRDCHPLREGRGAGERVVIGANGDPVYRIRLDQGHGARRMHFTKGGDGGVTFVSVGAHEDGIK